MNVCKICNSVNVKLLTANDAIEYKGHQLNVLLEYSVCEKCGREFVSKEQILNNEKIIRDAKKTFDGLFTSREIAEIRCQLGLTQEQASLVFGGGRNAFSKYERGEVSQSVAMDKLIKLAFEYTGVFRKLLDIANVDVVYDRVPDVRKINVVLKNLSYEKYEEDVINYSVFDAANQEIYSCKKTVEMGGVAYHG